MSRHRSEPPQHHQTHYGRIVVLTVSLLTTAVALLGGVGVLPSAADSDGRDRTDVLVSAIRTTASATGVNVADTRVGAAAPVELPDEPAAKPTSEPTTQTPARVDPADDKTLPARSGTGRRVVFSEDRQRVWLVSSTGAIRRTYLVSGSVTDNLDPGTYEVYSRSENAVGIDDSGTMQWFVRFTRGPSGAAIGFHTIPVDDGRVVQSRAELGTPRSHGCIRQSTPDAKALWAFAPLGTTVVVV
ncbi:L,D-transpeptidase [Nocardioides plantarum]|uniref:L,D-transpeptidase n=1 Tax=Nocardioides plantarum TaxID=29299 RepID=A0ABV5KBB9_9ACTN|nr:L,D-transpeptidase [Nocardioides plantarum]